MKLLVLFLILKLYAQINIFKLLNYFVVGACKMLNLVNQNKQDASKNCDFTRNDNVKKLHFCYICKGYIISHKRFWIHQYLYFHKICKRIVCTYQKLSAEAWKTFHQFPSRYQKWRKQLLFR